MVPPGLQSMDGWIDAAMNVVENCLICTSLEGPQLRSILHVRGTTYLLLAEKMKDIHRLIPSAEGPERVPGLRPRLVGLLQGMGRLAADGDPMTAVPEVAHGLMNVDPPLHRTKSSGKVIITEIHRHGVSEMNWCP